MLEVERGRSASVQVEVAQYNSLGFAEVWYDLLGFAEVRYGSLGYDGVRYDSLLVDNSSEGCRRGRGKKDSGRREAKTKLVTIEVGWKLFEGPKRSQNPGTDRYDAHQRYVLACVLDILLILFVLQTLLCISSRRRLR